MVRTTGFHPGNRGSIPRAATKKHLYARGDVFVYKTIYWYT